MSIVSVSIAPLYRYKGVTFEWWAGFGPVPVRRKDFEPLDESSMSARRWATINQWMRLSDDEKREFKL